MSSDTAYDLMISYNWSQAHIVDQLESKLSSAGYKVWRDKNEMPKHDNLFIGMAKGITHSRLILLLVSKEYENSNNCKLEYEHVQKCKKDFIPIKVEKYDPPPDSSLSIILGQKLYYSLYDPKDFEETLDNILKGIQAKIGEGRDPVERADENEVVNNENKETKEKHSEPTDILNKRKVFMQLVNKKLVYKKEQQRPFATALLKEFFEDDLEEIYDVIEDVFQKSPDHPIMAIIYYAESHFGIKGDFETFMTRINDALKTADAEGLIVNDNGIARFISKIEKEVYQHIDFTDRNNRLKVYGKIAKDLPNDALLLGHYLLDSSDFNNLNLAKEKSNRGLVHKVLEEWEARNGNERRTWRRLRFVLLALNFKNLVEEIHETFA